jgi:hypothetical protein
VPGGSWVGVALAGQRLVLPSTSGVPLIAPRAAQRPVQQAEMSQAYQADAKVKGQGPPAGVARKRRDANARGKVQGTDPREKNKRFLQPSLRLGPGLTGAQECPRSDANDGHAA